MVLNYILRKCTRGYKFTKPLETISMDNIKTFAKNEKKNGNSNTNNKNIQPGYRNVVWC